MLGWRNILAKEKSTEHEDLLLNRIKECKFCLVQVLIYQISNRLSSLNFLGKFNASELQLKKVDLAVGILQALTNLDTEYLALQTDFLSVGQNGSDMKKYVLNKCKSS